MAVYEYEGIDGNGKTVRGIVDSDSPRSARALLKRDGVFATALVIAERSEHPTSTTAAPFWRRSIPLGQLALITRQLSTLLNAGLPLVSALTSLVEQTEEERTRLIYSQIRERVNEGKSFYEALAEHPRTFSDFYRNMVRAGEAGGTLPLVLARLADFLEASMAFRQKVQAAMTYPAIMGVVGVSVLMFLLTSVVPQITGIFTNLGKELPPATRVLLALSNAARDYWILGVGFLAAAGILIASYIRTPAGKLQLHGTLLRIPRVGTFLRLAALARFCKTLGTLVAGGVPLLVALDISRPVVGNAPIEQSLEQVSNDVREGRSLSQALKSTGHFPSDVRQMVAVGEESGTLDSMLLKIADTYEGRVGAAVASLTSLMGPLMILFMGVAVGFVVYAILLPIFNLTEALR
jgi:general secretion pathway protein F